MGDDPSAKTNKVGVIGFGVYEYLRIAPNDVRFTNVTSSSVTVSWNTKSPTSATAMVFEGDTWLPVTLLSLGGERFYEDVVNKREGIDGNSPILQLLSCK